MDFLNSFLCMLEDLLGTLFGLLNDTLGALFGFELDVPDLGCIR